MAANTTNLNNIEHFVVLMLENRSFDHLLGYMRSGDARIAGLSGNEFNYMDPNNTMSSKVSVARATAYAMPFDPGHEFPDVQTQLYGPGNPPVVPSPMSGFVSSASNAANAAKVPDSLPMVMQCFQSDQIPVISTLAQEFALFNYWHSSLPGPTWPNRFFVHAATSGGLTDSPDTDQILGGYDFKNGTIYDRIGNAGKKWRIYHDGSPQTAGINSLRLEYINPFTENFRAMSNFVNDVKSGDLPDYTFIEPNYDAGGNYQNGNSMHPLNDLRKGEVLVKHVYESLRANPAIWNSVLFVVAFDEHGGFYDHVPPPAAVPTGDDAKYASRNFGFNRYGVRVPAIAISPFIQRGTVIGSDPTNATTIFDHASILATVEKRFGLSHLTQRDTAANTIDVALNLNAARTDTPATLPDPGAEELAPKGAEMLTLSTAASTTAPLSKNQQAFLDLARACDFEQTKDAAANIKNQKDAATYIKSVESKILARRKK